MSAQSTEGYAQSWLNYEKVLGSRPILTGTPEELMEQYIALGTMLASQAPPPDPSVHTRDDSADGVPVRIYTPEAAALKKLPLGIYFHGGGYVLGDLNGEDAWCRYIAKNTPCIIVSADYRLAPKFKHPSMLMDCITAFNWAYRNADTIRADNSQTFTVGASAGGGLALTVVDQLIKSGKRNQVKGAIAMVPVAVHPDSIPSEYASHYTSHIDNASGVPMIDMCTMKTFYDASAASPQDEKIFVTLSKDLAQFPPTYIATCGKDPLRDDGKVLEMMLKKEGVKTKSNFYDGLPHYFWMMPGIEGGPEFLEAVVDGVHWALSQPDTARKAS